MNVNVKLDEKDIVTQLAVTVAGAENDLDVLTEEYDSYKQLLKTLDKLHPVIYNKLSIVIKTELIRIEGMIDSITKESKRSQKILDVFKAHGIKTVY